MTRSLFALAGRNLLGANRGKLGGPNEEPVNKVYCKLLKRLSLLGSIWVDVVSGVIAIKGCNIRELDDIFIKDLHPTKRLYADAQSVRSVLVNKAGIRRINVPRGYVDYLAIHRASRVKRPHLAAQVCLDEKVGDALRNVLRQRNSHSDYAHRICAEISVPLNVSLDRCRFRAAIHVQLVQRQSVTVSARAGNLPAVNAINGNLSADNVLDSLHAAARAISDEKSRQSRSSSSGHRNLSRHGILVQVGVAA